MAQLTPVSGDITKLAVDAIVNAANESLLGGGGVDGAIHRAAGPELLAACRKLNGCATGDAKATPGFRLPAKWIFHAVGPVWHGGAHGEDDLLANCYRRCLELALEVGAKSLAFPAISTGVYSFPPERAAKIAIATVRSRIEESGAKESGIDELFFVCFNSETLRIYQHLLSVAHL
jgi:O-acetyl-ADP-ribose deacetylase (regulator of RNase III)